MQRTTNLTESPSSSDPWLTELSTGELVAWCLPCGFVAIAAIFGNALVIASFFLSTNLRHQVVVFVAGLAVADILVGLISIPMWIYMLFLAWKTNRPSEDVWVTLIYDALDVFAASNSIFHLTAISIERFFATVYPHRHRNIPKRLYCILLTGIWITSALVSSSFFLPIRKESMEFRFYLMNLLFVISLVIISVSYTGIWFKAKTRLRITPDTTMKMSCTLLIVIGLFVLAWSPFFVVRAVLHFCQHYCVSWRIFYLTKLFHFSNSAVNPLVYGFRIPEYKAIFFKLLRIKFTIPKRDSIELDSFAVKNSPRSSRALGKAHASKTDATSNYRQTLVVTKDKCSVRRSSLPVIPISSDYDVISRSKSQEVIFTVL